MIYFFIGTLLLIILYLIYRLYQQSQLQQTLTTMMDQHVDEVESMYKSMRSIRHDHINQIQVLKALNLEQKNREIQEYLNQMDHELNQVETIVRTGHATVDAIINSKLSLARDRKIELNVRALVPNQLPISNLDLGIILNNLLANAIEASIKAHHPFIRFYMAPIKGNLYISCTNSTHGKVMSLSTTKIGNEHGFGISRINRVVQKNQGWILRGSEEGVFSTEIYLPLM